MRATVRTEGEAILGLVRAAGGHVHVAFEEGTQAQWRHDLLEPHAEKLSVCNVRGKSEAANRSDRIDADEPSEKLRLGSLKAVCRPQSEGSALARASIINPEGDFQLITPGENWVIVDNFAGAFFGSTPKRLDQVKQFAVRKLSRQVGR